MPNFASVRAAGVSLALLAGCSRQPDVAAGRFEARMEGVAAETVGGAARFCPSGRGGSVSMLSDDGRFGVLLHITQVKTGKARLTDLREYDPEQPKTIAVDMFVPPDAGGEPYITGGTLTITTADSTSARGTFQLSSRPADASGGASTPALSVRGAFSARYSENCGGG